MWTTPVVIGLPLTVKIVDDEAVLVEYFAEVDAEPVAALVLLATAFNLVEDGTDDLKVLVEVNGQ